MALADNSGRVRERLGSYTEPQQAQPGLYLLTSEFIALWDVSMIKTQWRMNIVLAKSPVLWFYCSWIFGKPLANTSHHNSSIILNQKRKKTCPNQSIFFLNACQKAKSVNINNSMVPGERREDEGEYKILPPFSFPRHPDSFMDLISNSESLKLTRFNYLSNTNVNNGGGYKHTYRVLFVFSPSLFEKLIAGR